MLYVMTSQHIGPIYFYNSNITSSYLPIIPLFVELTSEVARRCPKAGNSRRFYGRLCADWGFTLVGVYHCVVAPRHSQDWHQHQSNLRECSVISLNLLVMSICPLGVIRHLVDCSGLRLPLGAATPKWLIELTWAD